MRFKIMTLGCKVNQAESSGLAQALRERALTEADSAADADFLIVNSCAVTGESVRKAKQLLRSLKRRNPQAKLILTGCWPQAFPDDEFEDADFVTGTKNRDALLEWIMQAQADCLHAASRRISPAMRFPHSPARIRHAPALS